MDGNPISCEEVVDALFQYCEHHELSVRQSLDIDNDGEVDSSAQTLEWIALAIHGMQKESRDGERKRDKEREEDIWRRVTEKKEAESSRGPRHKSTRRRSHFM